MSTRQPSLAEVIGNAIKSHLLEARVSLPGRIVRYDASKQQVDVQPLIQRVYFDEEGARQVESLPVVPNVPVLFPGGGGFAVTFPIHASDTDGDTCLLVFADYSLDKWLTGTGGQVDPEIDHTHDLTDAVAIVGLNPFGAPLANVATDHATIGKSGADDGSHVKIHLQDGTITIGDMSGSDFIALAQKVLDELNAIKSAFSHHTHGFGTLIGTSATGGAVTLTGGITGQGPTYNPSSVAASQAKAK